MPERVLFLDTPVRTTSGPHRLLVTAEDAGNDDLLRLFLVKEDKLVAKALAPFAQVTNMAMASRMGYREVLVAIALSLPRTAA